jgi:hypothetical protein
MRASRAVASQSSADRVLPLLLAVLLSGGMIGCGSAEYEARLAETVQYFAYLDRLNENLTDYQLDAHGIPRFRVPVPFRQVQRGDFTAPAGNAEGNRSENDYDWRQPDFLDRELPGLAGAWIAELGGTYAYAFILSNYELFLEQDDESAPSAERAADPMRFHDDVVTEVVRGLRLDEPPPNSMNNFNEQYPRGVGYTTPKYYTALRWPLGGGQDREPAVLIDDHGYTVELYQTQNDTVKVAVLFLIPVNLGSDGAQLQSRIGMCLETLEVSGQPPVRPRADGQPAPLDAPAF